MIKGFEELTKELTKYELDTVLPAVVNVLRSANDKRFAMTNNFIIFSLKKKDIKTTSVRVRKIIHYIRVTGIIERLIATSKGYYISHSEKELNDYIDSLLQRAASIEQIANQINYQKDLRFNKGSQKQMFSNE